MENDNIYAASRQEEWREQLRKSMSPKERTAIERVKMPELAPDYRITCNEEVNQGISAEMALLEAKRCLDCPNPPQSGMTPDSALSISGIAQGTRVSSALLSPLTLMEATRYFAVSFPKIATDARAPM